MFLCCASNEHVIRPYNISDSAHNNYVHSRNTFFYFISTFINADIPVYDQEVRVISSWFDQARKSKSLMFIYITDSGKRWSCGAPSYSAVVQYIGPTIISLQRIIILFFFKPIRRDAKSTNETGSYLSLSLYLSFTIYSLYLLYTYTHTQRLLLNEFYSPRVSYITSTS